MDRAISNGNLWGVTPEFPQQSRLRDKVVTTQPQASLSYLQLSHWSLTVAQAGLQLIQSTNLPLILLQCWDDRVWGYLARLT